MSDRNWDRELADLDRRLAAIPDPPQAVPTPARGVAPATHAPVAPAGVDAAPPTPKRARAPDRSIGLPAPTGRRSWRTQFALLFRLALGVAAIAALVYWPFPARCGVQLGYYLALVSALGLVGIANATSAWRHRSVVVHLLGLAMLAGAVVLGAQEILPKVGYAFPSLAHPATWSCSP